MDAISSPAPSPPPSRRRLRFSLLNLALVLTTVALGVGLYRAGQEVVPLRETVRRLREEMGYFQIDDDSRIHVKQVSTKLPSAWKWRVFLPEGQTYNVRCFCGSAPAPENMDREEWFQLLRTKSRGGGGDRLTSGEFGFESLLTEYDGSWYLRWGRVQDDGVTLTLPESADWLDDKTAWVVSSDASGGRPTSFAAGASVVLLHLEPKYSDKNGQAPLDGDAEGGRPRIVVWIEDASTNLGGAPLRQPAP